MLTAALGAQLVGLASGRILKDEIKQLPGWNAALPSRDYSGYIAVPGDHGPKMYHCESAEWCATPSQATLKLNPGADHMLRWRSPEQTGSWKVKVIPKTTQSDCGSTVVLARRLLSE